METILLLIILFILLTSPELFWDLVRVTIQLILLAAAGIGVLLTILLFG